jgi:hypothetical protein
MARPSPTILRGQADADRLARQAAQRAGVAASFVCADATTPVTRQTFELAYARLLLSHLVEPVAALRAMRAARGPTGRCGRGRGPVHRHAGLGSPGAGAGSAAGGLQRHRPLPRGRPDLGPRLPALLATVRLSDVGEQLVANPMTTVDQKLFLAELVDNMRQAILEARAASPRRARRPRAAVAAAVRDPGTVFHQARIHQAYGHRQD